MERDVDYFTRRADEERRAASNAECEKARVAHIELAQRYSALAGTAAPPASAGPETDDQRIM